MKERRRKKNKNGSPILPTAAPPQLPVAQSQPSNASTTPSVKQGFQWKELKLTLIGGFILLFFDKGVDFLKQDTPQVVVPQTVVPVSPSGEPVGQPFQMLVPIQVQPATFQQPYSPPAPMVPPVEPLERTFIDASIMSVGALDSIDVQHNERDIVESNTSLRLPFDSAVSRPDTSNGLGFMIVPAQNETYFYSSHSLYAAARPNYHNVSAGILDSLLWSLGDSLFVMAVPDTLLHASSDSDPSAVWCIGMGACVDTVLLDTMRWSNLVVQFSNPGVYHLSIGSDSASACFDSSTANICIEPIQYTYAPNDTNYSIRFYATTSCGTSIDQLQVLVSPNPKPGLRPSTDTSTTVLYADSNIRPTDARHLATAWSENRQLMFDRSGSSLQWVDWLLRFLLYTVFCGLLIVCYKNRRSFLFWRS